MEKKLRYEDRNTTTTRAWLKKDKEILSDRTEDFHLTYAWQNWGLHKIIGKIEDLFGKNSDAMICIQIQWEYNW